MQDQTEINRLKAVVQQLLDQAAQQGATAAEAAFSVDNGLSVSARLGDVETVEYHCDQGIGVTVYFDQKKGSASTNDVSETSLTETVKAACSIARYASPDEFAGLPDKDHLATSFPDLDLNHPWALDASRAIELAIECEDAARHYHSAISNSEGATVNAHQGTRVFGNSLGFLEGYQSSRHSLSCSVLAGTGDAMQRDYWYSVARNPNLLEPAVQVGEKAAQRTLARMNARSLTTRHCPVLFSAEMASGLIGSLMGAISGGSLYRKASFLLDSLNTQILPDFVRIHEQPLLVGGLGSANFDAEGVATQTRDIVSHGILRSYLLSSYSARKLGMRTTGNAGGVHNLIIEPGDNDFAGMLNQLGTGLLVTELMGQGINRVTGDYSRGASGFWVENGSIQYPVQGITIAGNLKKMLRHLVAIGNDVDLRGNIRVGSILLEQMAIAGD
ncbi:MAG: metalloprotease PmbA [Gammaproteobacteria bacterium]